MNERIKELIKQATEVRQPAPHSNQTENSIVFNKEKFAELIIEECAFQCQHLGDMERIGKHFEVDVFKQFGVE